MKRHRWMILAVLGFLAWVAMGLGPPQAQGAVIYPLNAANEPDTASPWWVSIIDPATGQDITDSWLPEAGQTVWFQVNNLDVSNIYPVDTGTVPTTSRNPGVCSNTGDPTDTSPDFEYLGQVQGTPYYQMMSLDCGGSAVVHISGAINGANVSAYVVMPQDWDLDGIPDIYELRHSACATCLVPDADQDAAHSHGGDGWLNINEYRGVMAEGVHRRGDPNVKEFYFAFIENPLCPNDPEWDMVDDLGNSVSVRSFFREGLTPLFARVYALAPDLKVYRVLDGEYENYFDSYDCTLSPSVGGGVQLKGGSDPTTDRQINKCGLLGAQEGILKVARLSECLDILEASPFGTAHRGYMWDVDKEAGDCQVYPQRIWLSLKKKFAVGGGKLLRHYAYDRNGDLTAPTIYPHAPPTDWQEPFADFWWVDPDTPNEGVQTIAKEAVAWYVGHELNHVQFLTLAETIVGTGRKAKSYFYHRVPEFGSTVDFQIVQKIDTKGKDQYNNWYIPKYSQSIDLSEMQIIPVP